MAIRFNCSSCQRVLEVAEEFAGRSSKCPGCATPLTVPQAPAAVAPPSGNFNFTPQAPAGAPSARPGLSEGVDGSASAGDWSQAGGGASGAVAAEWQSVRAGLRLIEIGSLIYIGTMIATMVLAVCAVLFVAFLSSQSGGGGPPLGSGGLLAIGGVVLVFMFLYLAGLATGHVFRLVGFIRWLQVPKATNAQGLAIGAMVCEIIVIACLAIGTLMGLISPAFSQIASLFQYIGFVVGTILLLIFLHHVANFIDSAQLRARVKSFAIWFAGSAGVLLAGCFLMFAIIVGIVGFSSLSSSGSRPASQSADAMLTAMGGVFIAFILYALVYLAIWIVLTVMYIALLRLASSEIGRRGGFRPV